MEQTSALAMAALAAGLCVALSACTGAPRAQAPPPAPTAPTARTAAAGDAARGVVAVTVRESREGDAALLRGRLEVECCVFVRGADGERRLLVLAMRPARWDEATSTLQAGARRFAAGDPVAATGGELEYYRLEGAWENAPRPSCRTPHVWVAHRLD